MNTRHESSVTTEPRDLKKAADNTIDTMGEKAKDMANKVADYVSQAKDTVQDWTSSATESLSQAKDSAQEWASEAMHKTGEYAQDFGQELTNLIRRYPVPALLIGFGLGFMLARATKD